VIRSEETIKHLVKDSRELVADQLLELGRQLSPDICGSGGHTASHCSARVMSWVTESEVSLVKEADRGGARLEALRGMRKVKVWR